MKTYITLSPLKTGKGNNTKLRRSDVEAAVKTLNKYAEALPASTTDEPVAYEFAALSPAQQLGAIAADFTGLLTTREFSAHLKIARTNLGDLCAKLTTIGAFVGGDAQNDLGALAAKFNAILNPPQPEKKTKKGKTKAVPVQPVAKTDGKPAAKPKTK